MAVVKKAILILRYFGIQVSSRVGSCNLEVDLISEANEYTIVAYSV